MEYGVWHDIESADQLSDGTYAVLNRQGDVDWGYWYAKEKAFVCMEWGGDEGTEIYDVTKFYIPHPINKI